MASAQSFDFVLPESADLVSGGNLYNAALLASLAEHHQVRRRSILDFCKSDPGPGTYLLDSLNLAEIHAMQLQRAPERNLLLMVHALPSLLPVPKRAARLLIERATLPLFDAFVCTSDFTASYLRSCAWGQPSITIEPVISVPALIPARATRSVQALMSCNLIQGKGVLEFLEALAATSASTDSFHLTVVGRHDMEADYGKACTELVRNSDRLKDRVSLPGESPKSEMHQWYETSNLFVSASRMETFGISLQEARYFGLPILAVRGGNSANHVAPGLTGEVCEDPTLLATEFLRWARDGELLSSYLEQAQALRPTEGGDWAEAANRLMGQLAAWFP